MNFKKSWLAPAILIAFSACKAKDYSTREESTMSQGTTVDTMMHTPIIDDTASSPSTASTAVITDTKGTAVPNPAKKGGKAKIRATINKNSGQTSTSPDNTGYYYNVEVMPSFTGGQSSMEKYFSSNIRYPQDALDNGVEGTVNVTFDVDDNGVLHSPRIVGPKVGYGIDEEALRLVNNMPAWVAGKIKGKNVKTHVTLPVTFILE